MLGLADRPVKQISISIRHVKIGAFEVRGWSLRKLHDSNIEIRIRSLFL